MNISLTPELERMVQERVQSGLYNNASEVIREALRLLVKQDRRDETYEEYLKREIQIGLDALAEGRVYDYDFEDIKQELARRRSALRSP